MRKQGSKDKKQRKSRISNIRENTDKIIELYKKDYSCCEIARMYYVSHTSIRRILKEQGIYENNRHYNKKHSDIFWNDSEYKF